MQTLLKGAISVFLAFRYLPGPAIDNSNSQSVSIPRSHDFLKGLWGGGEADSNVGQKPALKELMTDC